MREPLFPSPRRGAALGKVTETLAGEPRSAMMSDGLSSGCGVLRPSDVSALWSCAIRPVSQQETQACRAAQQQG